MCSTAPQTQNQLNDMDLANWFTGDSLFDNLRTAVGRVILTSEPDFSPITYSSDSKCIFFKCLVKESKICIFLLCLAISNYATLPLHYNVVFIACRYG